MERKISQSYFNDALEVMPGGVNSPVRAFKAVGGTPITFAKGEGPWLTDVDGNRYLDFCCSWGPLILGHAHPRVVEAIEEVLRKGWSFGAPHRSETELARVVLQKLEFAERIRFVNSGTEAVMTAIRLARGVTGRPLIIKFEGCYHGHVDSLLVKAGSGLATFGSADSAGVPEQIAATTLILPLDDEEALRKAFEEHGGSIAAAIIETIPANNGFLQQRQEFMALLRKLTEANESLLICDEVLVGFRDPEVFAFRGYLIEPDLVTLGKVIGGGFPVGAVAGSEKTMSNLAPSGLVYQAGTLSGNPVAMTAGRATIEVLFDAGEFDTLQQNARYFLDTLSESLRSLDLPVGLTGKGSIFWIYFDSDEPPRDAAGITSAGIKRYADFHAKLLEGGVYFAPSGYEVGFLNSAMSRADLEFALEVIVSSVKAVFS